MSTREREFIDLPVTSPGTGRRIKLVRYGGAQARPKAYLQTALHADEIPGMLVLHYLDLLLNEADRADRIRGQVLLVPVANPVGLSQYVRGHLSGRFELGSGVNFNRGYPDVSEEVANRIEEHLSDEADRNIDLIRGQTGAVLAETPAPDEVSATRKILLTLAHDSDICLDLHCDSEAIMHVYLGTPLWPDAADLPAQLQSEATLLAEISGGHPFDEAVSGIWWSLAKRFPNYPVSPACLSATVELRGGRDVSHATAQQDADNLFRFLMRRGLVEGDPGPLPQLLTPATPLEGVDTVRAPCAGAVVYLKKPGDKIEAGETVVEIVDPWVDAIESGPVPVCSRVTGVLYSHRSDRHARPGQILCRIAGAEPLPERVGESLLSD